MDQGHIAYNAYLKASEGKSLISGEPLPEFLLLPEQIQKAWGAAEAAAQAEATAKLKNEFQGQVDEIERLARSNDDLRAQLEVEKVKLQRSQGTFPLAGLPPVGEKVTFVNHAGHAENAVVTGHSGVGVHLDIQGAHVNDKYKRQDIPHGGPGQRLTFY